MGSSSMIFRQSLLAVVTSIVPLIGERVKRVRHSQVMFSRELWYVCKYMYICDPLQENQPFAKIIQNVLET